MTWSERVVINPLPAPAGSVRLWPMTIRAATLEDVAAIADVHMRSWRVAYRGIIPDQALADLDRAWILGLWAERLRSDSTEPEAGMLVAERAGTVVAFAGFAPADDPEAPERSGKRVMELGSFYSVPEVWGSGLNRELSAAVHTAMLKGPCDEAFLWVLTANSRARRFYEAWGWRDTGVVADQGLLRGTVVRSTSLYRRRLRP